MNLPPRLAALQLTAGSYRAGLKILVYGRFKTGKSYLAASAPGPIIALANGEPGIIPYLDPKRGDVGLEIHTASDYYAALEFAAKHEKDFATLVSDNDTLAWAQTMEDYQDSVGREIKGSDWRKIKGPRKAALRQLGRSRMNVVFTTWLRDTVYKAGDSGIAGVEGKMEILQAEIPDVEKTTMAFPDLIFQTDVLKDKLQKPTNIHTVTFVGGRRPRTVSPEDLYTGKVWKFDSRKPVSVWDTVIAPFHKVWSEGGEEHLGLAAEPQVEWAKNELMGDEEDAQVGRILTALAAAANLTAAKRVWDDNEVIINELPEPKRAIVRAAKDNRKKELSK